MNFTDNTYRRATETEVFDLFCLPYAGGHKYSYRGYQDVMPSFIHMQTVEYPGRVGRMKEAPLSDIHDLVNEAYQQITPHIKSHDYAIYGHSMGGLMAYLLTHKLIANGFKKPVHLFITGTSGPSAMSRFDKIRHKLPHDEFIAEMKILDGIPEEILSNPELLGFFEPILRADFQACETYKYVPVEPLDIPITVITGSEEDMKTEDIRLWQTETTAPTKFVQLPGKHFFIHKYPFEIVQIIAKTLKLK